jgi:NADPH:quinone reductase-like Zn-dependent oxidoreductase
MRAIVQTEYGSADVLALAEIDRPVIGATDVLVQVRAAGVSRGTWHIMTGKPYPVRLAGYGVRAPKNPVPDAAVAGVVVAAGSDVSRFGPGDEVFGMGRGGYAEYAAAPEDKLVRKPPSLTFEQAAALPDSGPTALLGLRDVGRLAAGQQVLITGASGGVGTYAVQIAKALGATVTGVCSTAKVDLVRSLGADRVVDYTSTDFTAGPERYDLILDIGGNAPLRRVRRVLTPRGTLVIAGGETGGRWLGGTDRLARAKALSLFVGQRLTTFIATEHHAPLQALTELVGSGRVVPVIERSYPLSDLPEAVRHLEAGRARGKLVITL